MKSIKARFDKIRAVKTAKSDYICFAEAITNQGFTKESITRWFSKLVDKNDYEKKERQKLLRHLWEINKVIGAVTTK